MVSSAPSCKESGMTWSRPASMLGELVGGEDAGGGDGAERGPSRRLIFEV